MFTTNCLIQYKALEGTTLYTTLVTGTAGALGWTPRPHNVQPYKWTPFTLARSLFWSRAQIGTAGALGGIPCPARTWSCPSASATPCASGSPTCPAGRWCARMEPAAVVHVLHFALGLCQSSRGACEMFHGSSRCRYLALPSLLLLIALDRRS